MTIIDAIILGFVQGVSEFLPISSSAHLVITQTLLGVHEPGIVLEVALHLGTLFSVLIYFRRDITRLISGFIRYMTTDPRELYRDDFRLCLYIILGSIPAAVGGLLLKDWFEARFDSVAFSGYMLLITGAFLLATKFARDKDRQINVTNSLVIGVAQFCAILPGISRSGSTIATGLFLGISPRNAARFSFLLSLPAVAGASLLKLRGLAYGAIPSAAIVHFALGAVVSFLVGYIAIHYLLKLVAGRRFYFFGFYCVLVGIFTILHF